MAGSCAYRTDEDQTPLQRQSRAAASAVEPSSGVSHRKGNSMLLLAIQVLAAAAQPVPLYSGLGNHHHAISTRVAQAQAYFNQGVKLTYAFNHAEAVRSFREAQRLDPACAMCYWGEALALGPNINGAMDSASGAAAWKAMAHATELAPRASERERAWIRALSLRYGPDPLAKRSQRDSAWAEAMSALAAQYPADDDAQVLAAEALMNLSPWDYYLPSGAPRPNGAGALALLEKVLHRSPAHAGACHYFIHAVEAVAPERAVPCADRLPSLMPGAGHIVHMPAHIYIRVGRYDDAIDNNLHAVHADEEHIADMAPDAVYRLGYYPHNYHFLWFAATMAGREETAITAANNVAARTNRDLLLEPELGALQHYLVTPLFAQVRFQRWTEVLATPEYDEKLLYANAIRHYARVTAFSSRGNFEAAEKELELLSQAAAAPGIDKVLIWGLNSWRSVLAIAVQAAAGELALRRGEVEKAISILEEGVRLEDQLVYDEPPTWHLSVRLQLGEALLEAGRKSDARRVYAEDQKRHPNNVWSR